MLIKHLLYLVNVLVRAFEGAIGWVMGVMESLRLIRGCRMIVISFLQIFRAVDRLLLVGKRYLEQVRGTLRYRLYFESVTRPMRARYKQLKRG
jgi:hypothetical protein